MLFRWAVAFSLLLILAAGGCRSALPVMTEQWQDDAGNSQVEPATDDETELVHFEEPNSQAVLTLEDDNPSEEMTLADLEGIAFEHNPTLSAAAARMEIASGRQFQAGRSPNPVVGYHATEVGNLGTAGQQGGFISQRFITAGKLQLDQQIAGKEIDAAHYQFHAQEQRVLSDVRVRFYDVLVAQRRVELTKELVDIGDNLVEAAETLLDGRQGTPNDLLQAQIRADEAHILYDNARNELAESWRRLAATIGQPTMSMKPLVGQLDIDVPNYEWDDCHTIVLGSNPQLNAARARVDRAGLSIQRAQKEPIPNIDASVSVRHIYPTKSDVANIQIGIPIPIFDKNQGNIRSAEAEWIAANNEVERIELDLQDRLAVVYRQFANSRQQVDRYSQKMVPRAKQSLELVTDGYDKGQVNYLTMLTAQQTYVQVSLSYLASLRELRTSTAVIEGQLLTGSLSGRK
ncbi:MAG: TolC family protein [Planctomycetaceae bacterium]|nr:TolC family protein [Planctomycetaceae bacterium]MBT6154615.1 TolC family protein [Planctomycetaceae bacterium]MBT6487225.1 TolC family protein [Planctomycetaceae bacterium]MBT6495151.1 TolC family protein [Planctomycetaceae bacterium]